MTKEKFLETIGGYNESIRLINESKYSLIDIWCRNNRKFINQDVVTIGDNRQFVVVGIDGYDEENDEIVYNTLLLSNAGEVTKRGKRIGEKAGILVLNGTIDPDARTLGMIKKDN